MSNAKFVPIDSYREYPAEEMKRRAATFRAEMCQRRSVRTFSTRPVAREVIEECLLTAGSAPSGANQQPWTFVVVSDPDTKQQIREAAEKEEYEFYHGKAPEQWREAVSILGTDDRKPYLETAPYLIVIFSQTYGVQPDGRRARHYYVRHSVGIATGLLIAAIHHAGLVTLPYTPAKMGFLSRILRRPENEQPYLVLVVGYPAEGTQIPEIKRKTLREIATFV